MNLPLSPELARYTAYLEQVLTPSRLQHSFGVMQVMQDLAGIYGLERETALAAGLLHDAGKDLPSDRIEQIVAEAGFKISSPEDQNYLLYLHAPVGAYLVRQELGITDPVVLDAIHRHTYYGEAGEPTPPLLWCLRFSDILEPNRNWSRVPWLHENGDRLRKIVYAGRLEEAAFLHTGGIIYWFDGAGMQVHPNMRLIYQELSANLGLDETFITGRRNGS